MEGNKHVRGRETRTEDGGLLQAMLQARICSKLQDVVCAQDVFKLVKQGVMTKSVAADSTCSILHTVKESALSLLESLSSRGLQGNCLPSFTAPEILPENGSSSIPNGTATEMPPLI